MEDRLLYTMALGFTRGIGPITAKVLVDHFGHAEQLYQFLRTDSIRLHGFGQRILQRIQEEGPRSLTLARREKKRVESIGLKMYGHWDPEFPKRLWQCPDSPLIVYIDGLPLYNRERTVCILGSELCSGYGRRILTYLLKQLKSYGVTVICGSDSPWDLMVLEQSINLQIGVTQVLSQNMPRGKYKPLNQRTGCRLFGFPPTRGKHSKSNTMNNRLLAGLSDLCIVIEASKFDQALNIADMANQYHRDVAAFPGPIWSEPGFGTNLLIKSHRASLISSVQDIKYITGWKPV